MQKKSCICFNKDKDNNNNNNNEHVIVNIKCHHCNKKFFHVYCNRCNKSSLVTDCGNKKNMMNINKICNDCDEWKLFDVTDEVYDISKNDTKNEKNDKEQDIAKDTNNNFNKERDIAKDTNNNFNKKNILFKFHLYLTTKVLNLGVKSTFHYNHGDYQ